MTYVDSHPTTSCTSNYRRILGLSDGTLYICFRHLLIHFSNDSSGLRSLLFNLQHTSTDVVIPTPPPRPPCRHLTTHRTSFLSCTHLPKSLLPLLKQRHKTKNFSDLFVQEIHHFTSVLYDNAGGSGLYYIIDYN